MQPSATAVFWYCLWFALLHLATTASAIAQSADDTRDELILVHRLSMPTRAEWRANSVPMVTGGWRIGTVKGAQATDEQLRAVLSDLTDVQISLRCTGWIEGQTHYPCGLSVRNVEVAGTALEPYTLVAMTDPTTVPGDAPTHGSGHASTAASVLRRDVARHVWLRLPMAAPWSSETMRIGDIIHFELRTISSNAIAPARFDRGSAVLVLRAPLRSARTLSPTDVYRHYVDAFSRGRIDEALAYFAPSAVVVAGPACSAVSPCVGREAIRERYLAVLIARGIPAPLIDQRYDGVRLTTRGEQVRLVGADGTTLTLLGGHTFEFADGRITSLTFALDLSDPVTNAFVAQAASRPYVHLLKER